MKRSFRNYARSFVGGLVLGAVSLLPACASYNNITSEIRQEMRGYGDAEEISEGCFIRRKVESSKPSFVLEIFYPTKDYIVSVDDKIIPGYSGSIPPNMERAMTVQLPQADGTRGSVDVTINVRDHDGKIAKKSMTFRYFFAEVGGILYDGEEAVEVLQKFHRDIVGVMRDFNNDYGVHVDKFVIEQVIYDDLGIPGFAYNTFIVSREAKTKELLGAKSRIKISSDSFSKEAGGLVAGLASVTHEMAHQKLNVEKLADSDIEGLLGHLYEEVVEEGIVDSFTESLYIPPNKINLGHPKDNPDELYASAFTIAKRLRDRFELAHYGVDFSEEQQELAERIFDFVSYKRPVYQNSESSQSGED